MLKKAQLGIQTVRELGIGRVGLYALYQARLRSGYYRRRIPSQPFPQEQAPALRLNLLPQPDVKLLGQLLNDRLEGLIVKVDEIVSGRVRLFGGDPLPLSLRPPEPLRHWSQPQPRRGDVKLVWEPARFGWAVDLGRAYLLTRDERYPAAFWQRWEQFQAENPANMGANWESAQEVALRLIVLSVAARLFGDSAHSTPERHARLAASLIDHARRIPPTLIYARAQNNNHLISEAAGLYTAGILLADFGEAAGWKQLGWMWLNRALQSQIEADGEYIQHSTNYHRMMLQLALFTVKLAEQVGEYLPSSSLERLSTATRWLLAHFDPISGKASNLGHNDGSNPLPFAAADYSDYRPVIQAASLAFLGRPALPAGEWDEYALWLGLPVGVPGKLSNAAPWRIERLGEWATLRARRYESRPAHADQLHVDLWHNGINILLDAGTYSYNAPPPWQNALAHTTNHNTLTIDERDQMQPASKFLWLRWAKAEWDAEQSVTGTHLAAHHDGYARLGIRHYRSLEWNESSDWTVTDRLEVVGRSVLGNRLFILHWLFPDGNWQLIDQRLELRWAERKASIAIEWQAQGVHNAWQRLVRAGQVLSGPPGDVATLGWYSPTYNQLVPALSFQTGLESTPGLVIRTRIRLETID